MRFRQAYYDLFSHLYDPVIALHSGDGNAAARDFLVERAGVEAGSRVKCRFAALALLAFIPLADAQAPPSIATLVQFNTVCTDCHQGECSGRLSFDSGPAAARSHIERYLGETHEINVASLFAMLRHVKEACHHYPVVPLRPATGIWEAEELAPWHNARAGAYFIPLGQLATGRRELILEFDRPAEGSARIDSNRMETAAEARLCRDSTKKVEFDAAPATTYYLHLESGTARLSRIAFR
jgi:hypothetical protein